MTFALQRTAGNRAVGGLVQGWRDGSTPIGSLAVAPPVPPRRRVQRLTPVAGRPVIQRDPFKEFVLGAVQGLTTTGIAEGGALLAKGAIAEAQKQTAALAREAVLTFLNTPEGRRMLHVAVAAKVGKEAGAEGAKALAERLGVLCREPLNNAVAGMRARMDDILEGMPDLTPQAVKDLREAFDKQVEEAKASAVAQQVQAVSDHVINGVKNVAGAITEAFAGSVAEWLIDLAIDTVFDGKQLLEFAGKQGLQAATGSDPYKKALQIVTAATKARNLVGEGIDAVDTVIQTVEQHLFALVPAPIRNVVGTVADKIGAGPRMAKRAGKKLVSYVVGERDALGDAQQQLTGIGNTGVEAGKKTATEAVDKRAAGVSAAITGGVQLGMDLANSEHGEEVATAGKTGAKMAVTYAGAAVAGAAATALALPAAPVLAIAGGILAARSEAGQAAIKVGAEIAQDLTQLPAGAGFGVQKGTQLAATVAAGAGAGYQWLKSWVTGDTKAFEASKQNISAKFKQVVSGWSLTNILSGADMDVLWKLTKQIVDTFGQGPALSIDCTAEERATKYLAKKAINIAYRQAHDAGIVDAIKEIEVRGKGFSVKIAGDSISFEKPEDAGSS